MVRNYLPLVQLEDPLSAQVQANHGGNKSFPDFEKKDSIWVALSHGFNRLYLS